MYCIMFVKSLAGNKKLEGKECLVNRFTAGREILTACLFHQNPKLQAECHLKYDFSHNFSSTYQQLENGVLF